MKPPRLLICCNSLAYFVNHRMAPALLAQQHGFEVHVAASADTDPDILSQHKIIYQPLVLARHRLAPLTDLAAALTIRRLVKTLAPDVVHAITMKVALVTLSALPRDTKQRQIVTFPGLGRIFSDPQGLWPGFRKRIVISLFKRYFRRHLRALASFENAADRELFVALRIVDRENTALLRGTGIDLSRFAPRETGSDDASRPPLVLFAGRLLRQKGIVEFLDAARAYLRNVESKGWPPAQFAVAGAPDPGNRDSIKKTELDALKDITGIKLLGHVADMPGLLRETDILCLPTRYGEGLPRVLLEAAASAVPAVATDVAGCREIVIDGETGRLVPPGNPQELLEALHELIEQPALRTKMSRNARNRVENDGFDEQTIARAVLALYRGG